MSAAWENPRSGTFRLGSSDSLHLLPSTAQRINFLSTEEYSRVKTKPGNKLSRSYTELPVAYDLSILIINCESASRCFQQGGGPCRSVLWALCNFVNIVDSSSKNSTWSHVPSLVSPTIPAVNKFALLWGEAQLCLPYVCL